MKKCNYHITILLSFLLMTIISSCNNETNDSHTGHSQQEQDVYTCPMHPEIIRSAPGTCPICGMNLVKKERQSKSVEDVALESVLKPSNSFVISSVPVTTLEQREQDVELNVVGAVAYDTRQSGAISARVSGRIERLYIRYKYQPVKKGQRIMDIYSPGLVTAQQNLLFLLRNDADNTSLINAAKERLALLGMSANQIAQVIGSQSPKYSVPVFSNYSGFVTDLDKMNNTVPPENMQVVTPSSQQLTIKEGMYVQSGQPVFSVYNSDRAWILLDIFPEQQNLIQQGNDVRIVPETAPQKIFRGKLDYIEPIFRTGNKTLTARIYFNNSSLHLPVGSRVTATIFASSKTANWLPKEAVLSLGRDKVVFKKEQGGFRTSKINTGMELNQYVQVTGGIEKTDSIAKNAQFLIDNEAFIKVNEP